MPRQKSAGASTSGEWIDPDDAPELTEEHFARADLYEGETLVRRGRPKSEAPKQQVTLRLSQDVPGAFPRHGRRLASPHRCGAAQGRAAGAQGR
ncbi:BrnA antitoxin family protein [Chelatococcus sp. GCM10030263]|uniref:BrnA antitoxin family protein n=1 Tax=Chelatococcus sp. GCM10030263 TaxID=3273387 RepID=UPI003605C6F6